MNDLAKQIGVTGPHFRDWLRAQKAAGHPVLVGHERHGRYRFTPSEANRLLAEFCADRRNPHGITPKLRLPTNVNASTRSPSRNAGHRVKRSWLGRRVMTLGDLLRPGLLAIVVGINPAPISVAAGHYWQGRTGRRLWERLRYVGLLPDLYDGFEDDAAFEAGVGFTDLVKLPTAKASVLTRQDLDHGRRELVDKLLGVPSPLVIFAFKKAARMLLGPFPGNGFVRDVRVGISRVYVMPGPYEKRETADETLMSLRKWVDQNR